MARNSTTPTTEEEADIEYSPPTKAHADRLFIGGNFGEAKVAYRQVLELHPNLTDVIARLGTLSLLSNELEQSIELLGQALSQGHRSRSSLEHLAEAYYRKADFAAAAYCYQRLRRVGLAGTLAAMAELSPYAMTGSLRRVTLPWVAADPLPVVQAEINGYPTNLAIDTGTGELLLAREFAVAAGIRHGGQERRSFAAGQDALVTYGHAEELRLADLRMLDLPVQILGLDPYFRTHFPDTPIHGILGTAVLSRFKATLDYREHQLALDPSVYIKAPPPKDDATCEAGTPFWIAENHLLLVHGSLSSFRRCLLFIDTGMAGAALGISSNTAAALGIKAGQEIPEIGVGGGGLVTGRRARVDWLRLDQMRRDRVEAMMLSAFPLEARFGFHIHALVAHQFFRNCRLTLDFPRMRMSLRSSACES